VDLGILEKQRRFSKAAHLHDGIDCERSCSAAEWTRTVMKTRFD
jgi:hypothetical protein